MKIIKLILAEHKEYGRGYIIEDLEGDCVEEGEVLFAPDNYLRMGKCDSFLNQPEYAKYDIFLKSELTIL